MTTGLLSMHSLCGGECTLTDWFDADMHFGFCCRLVFSGCAPHGWPKCRKLCQNKRSWKYWRAKQRRLMSSMTLSLVSPACLPRSRRWHGSELNQSVAQSTSLLNGPFTAPHRQLSHRVCRWQFWHHSSIESAVTFITHAAHSPPPRYCMRGGSSHGTGPRAPFDDVARFSSSTRRRRPLIGAKSFGNGAYLDITRLLSDCSSDMQRTYTPSL